MIDQLEARIRAKASQLDEARRIDVQQVENNNVMEAPRFLCMIEPAWLPKH